MNSIELYAELITINDEKDITDDDVELIIDNCIISNNDQQLNMKVNIKESIKKISKKLKKKIKDVIILSLKLTKIILIYVIKTALITLLPPVVNQLSCIGIDVLISIISSIITNKENKKTKDTIKQLTPDAIEAINKIVEQSKKVIKEQNDKLTEKINEIIKTGS